MTGSANSIAATLVPACCLLCEFPLDRASTLPVCSACLEVTPSVEGHACRICITRLDPDSFASRQDALCDECREKAPAFERVIAYGEYSGELRELIHLLKYAGVYPAAKVLARWMADALAPFRNAMQQPLVLTAVPLFQTKQRERGFNQSRLLAAELARELRQRGWHLREDYSLLHRSRATRSQSELNVRQRRANLRGVFASGPNIETARGATVLLVDDIVTTATTARQCSAVLKRKGVGAVWVAAAARSQRDDVTGWDGLSEVSHGFNKGLPGAGHGFNRDKSGQG